VIGGAAWNRKNDYYLFPSGIPGPCVRP